MLSDDRRAIVAWADGRGSETTVYLDRSATGVRFGAPQLLERFHDPDGLPSPAASPSLVRLSSESVLLAWAGSAAGHWVIRAAPVDLNGLGAISTIAAPSGDALLADLTAGPVGDALVLWTEPAPTAAGAPDMQRQALFAARGYDAAPRTHAVRRARAGGTASAGQRRKRRTRPEKRSRGCGLAGRSRRNRILGTRRRDAALSGSQPERTARTTAFRKRCV